MNDSVTPSKMEKGEGVPTESNCPNWGESTGIWLQRLARGVPLTRTSKILAPSFSQTGGNSTFQAARASKGGKCPTLSIPATFLSRDPLDPGGGREGGGNALPLDEH